MILFAGDICFCFPTGEVSDVQLQASLLQRYFPLECRDSEKHV